MDRLTSPKKRTSILAMHPGALGDVIIFGHLLSALDGRVTLVADREKAQLLAGVRIGVPAAKNAALRSGASLGSASYGGAPLVATTLDFNALPIHEVFADTPVDQCRLAKLLGRHDRLISCLGGGNPLGELRLAAMCQARDAVFLPVRPAEGFGGHLLDLWTDLLGLSPLAPGPAPWNVPRSWLQRGGECLEAAGLNPQRPHVVIHPGAGSPAKCWPVERFVELARLILRMRQAHNGGYGIVFVLGPVEQDRWPAEKVEGIRRGFPALVGPSLADLAGALKGAAAFVGNDSGVAHLAAAVGTPTVALFGPSDPKHFCPRGRAVTTICAARMLDVAPGRVLRVLEALLGHARKRSGSTW